MGKKSAPKAPDLSALAKASELQAELGYKTSQEQLAWAKEMWGKTENLLGPVLDIQQKIMQQNYETALKDRAEYEQYKPLRDAVIKDYQGYDTPERRAAEAGRAQAQVRTSNEAARQRSLDRLESFGIDPSQTRNMALDKNVLTQQAAQEAAAGNIARKTTEDTGRALRAEAINIGAGMPSNVAASYGMSLNAGNSAIANMNSAVGTGANTMGTGLQWGAYGTNATGQAANIKNSQFQNKLASYEAQGNPMELIATLGGTALGAMGMNTGGPVAPELQSAPSQQTPTGTDSVPAALTPGEYVIPKEVVTYYGTDKLNKMVEKARQATGIPARPQSPGTPVRLNVGGAVSGGIDDILGNTYANNQGLATTAANFRTNQAIARENANASMKDAATLGFGVGKMWKDKDKPDAAPETKAPETPRVAPAANPVMPSVSLESPTMSPAPKKPQSFTSFLDS